MDMIIPHIKDASLFFGRSGRSSGAFAQGNISCVNWPDDFPYSPRVNLIIAHTGEEICLKFFVDEDSVMAQVTQDNGEVWTDSCVEFFISFDDSGYYNFEFNAIGKMLLGFRKQKDKCEHASQQIIDRIKKYSSLGNEPFAERTGQQHWELDVTIPAGAFFKHNINSLSGIEASANFYKCGDNLSVPHFLSWQPIANPTPNFHLEKFFGKIIFE